jgi:uncharacterized protein
MRADDLPAVLALNRAHETELSPLAADELAGLVEQALQAWAVELDEALVGFAIALPPGLSYDSDNYRWFSERYADFVYLDRIAVRSDARRRGVAGLLYDELEALAASRGVPVACEVNLVPRNDPSLAFHAARGFEPVGELAHDGGKTVRMLVRPLTEAAEAADPARTS